MGEENKEEKPQQNQYVENKKEELVQTAYKPSGAEFNSLITKDKKENEKITKNDKNPIIEMPIVVLTNSYSASASEILTGALKDNEKATIVGTTTYGKGVIQTIHQLTDGSGLKITTNEYYTPNYNKINKIGIEPNIEVELPKEYENALVIPKDKDTQLQKAIELLK